MNITEQQCLSTPSTAFHLKATLAIKYWARYESYESLRESVCRRYRTSAVSPSSPGPHRESIVNKANFTIEQFSKEALQSISKFVYQKYNGNCPRLRCAAVHLERSSRWFRLWLKVFAPKASQPELDDSKNSDLVHKENRKLIYNYFFFSLLKSHPFH